MLGDRVGDDDPLAGGLGEVPGVDQELDGEDAQGRAGRHLVRADLDLAVQAADVPGLQRGLGRVGEPRLQGTVRSRWDSTGGGAEIHDRADQVIGQLGHVELGAHRGTVIAGFGHAAQDQLAGGQGGLGGAERIQAGPGGPRVGSGVALGGGRGEPAEVVGPARGVAGLLLAGQAFVDQVDQGPAVGRLQGDDYGRGARRHLGRALPAPGEDDAPAWLHLGEGAGHRMAGDDGPPVVATCPQVDPRGNGLPAPQPVRLRDQGERLVRAERDEHGFLERLPAPLVRHRTHP